jgi:hypothetical protein
MKTRKYFILVVVVFVLVAGLLVRASSKDVSPVGKITDRRAFLEGVLFAQQEITVMRLKDALRAPRDEKEIMAGLEGVGVLVENVHAEAEKCGLTRQLLQTDTELRLRQHGITVFTDEEAMKVSARHTAEQYKKVETLPLELRSLGETFDEKDSDEHFLQCLRMVIQHSQPQTSVLPPPYLYVNVNTTVSEENRRAAFAIQVAFKEEACLPRNSARRSAPVWEKASVGACSSSNLKDFVREALRDDVDEFINDYLAANPKDRSSEETQ